MNPATPVPVTRLRDGVAEEPTMDTVATEEPLEIRIEGRPIAVIMRTPGHDEDLAAGFLLTENVVKHADELFEISVCPSVSEGRGNTADVLLAGVQVDWASLTRHVFTSSSCGVCGKASVEAVFQTFPPVKGDWQIPAKLVQEMPEQLRARQSTFEQTGGLHACGLFNLAGDILLVREDVGRHNAIDKVLGFALREYLLPLSRCVLMVSGRVSFEIMQKALAAGIPFVAAVSAPSSLAVQFAQESGQTLVGFLRGNKMNVYAGEQRIIHL
jgi:FdhD protein